MRRRKTPGRLSRSDSLPPPRSGARPRRGAREAPDNETGAKVSTLIRTDGRSHSEVWAATEWAKFKAMVHAMPA